MRPGRCALEIRLHGQPEPVRVIRGIVVPPGQDARPQQIQQIDLSWQLRNARITIVAARGRLPFNLELRLFRGRGRMSAEWMDGLMRYDGWGDGSVDAWLMSVGPTLPVTLLVDCESRLDVEIVGNGIRSEQLENVCCDHQVVLRPAIPIRLWFDTRRFNPPPKCSYSVILERLPDSSCRPFRFPSDRGDHYAAKSLPNFVDCGIGDSGRYRVEVRVRADFLCRELRLADEVIDVRIGPTMQEFIVPIDSPQSIRAE
jgi:hypothetical protein